MRTVVIGIAPVREGDEGQPLSSLKSGATGRRLADLAGISSSEWMKSFDRVNLCPFPQKGAINPKGWRAAAENLAGSILVGRRVILLGSNVALCFGLRNYDYCEWREGRPRYFGYRAGSVPPFFWAVLPHASGLNRWYNDPENRVLASEFLKRELGE